MKRRILAVLLGVCVCTASLCSCGTSGDTAKKQQTEAKQSETLWGEVVSVSDDGLIVNLGTRKEMQKPENTEKEEKSSEEPENAETEGSSEASGNVGEEENSEVSEVAGEAAESGQFRAAKAGEQPSMLDLTGEQQEITVTEDTVITKQSMGMPGGSEGSGAVPGKPGGGSEGEAPEKPEGRSDGEAPEKPEGSSDSEASEKPEGSPDSEAPEKPEGGSDSESPEKPGGSPDGEAPEKPEGAPNGESSQPPEGGPGGGDPSGRQQGEEISLSEIQAGDVVAVTLDEDGNAAAITVMSMGFGGPGGGQAAVESYAAVTEYTSDTETEGETYTSTGTDENAVHVYEGAQAVLKNPSISRSSEDSTGGDQSSFYGVGAAVLASEGSACIEGGEIHTDAAGGAGLFAYNKGSIYAADTVISTTQDTSGGIHAAGGGSLYAWNLQVETQGESSAAIRSDRGGGKMVIDGGKYVSGGTGSPVIYSTADIAVNQAQLTANGSEAICIEGRNSIHLYDSDLTGNMSDDARNDTTWNVILYQSMSGDSEVGNSVFEMQGGTLKAGNGGMFYTTNTESTITLWDVDISYAKDSEYFLKCTGNSNQRGWGTGGENGADCLFTAISQQMEGNVIWDSISQLDMYVTEGSSLSGAIVKDDSNAGDGKDGYCDLYISEDSEWVVTADSVLRNLYCDGTISDDKGETVTIEGTDGTIYEEGSGEYTITAENYETEADLSGASAITPWSEYQTEKPSQMA